MKYNGFEDMPVWQKAIDLAEEIYEITDILPKKEDYGLTSQIRRAIVSVSSNLAEGFGRESSKDKVRFYIYARGSLSETKSQLIYGERVNYFKETKNIFNNISELWKELNFLISYMRKNQP